MTNKQRIVLTVCAVLVGGVLGAAMRTWWPVHAVRSAPAIAEQPAALPSGTLHFPADAPQLTQLSLALASDSAVPLVDALPGRIAYDEDATTRVFAPVAGYILHIAAQLGDPVKAGAVLLSMDAPELGSALADQGKARAESAQKQAAYQRVRQLAQAEIVPQRDLETAQSDWLQAQAEMRRADLRLNNLTRGLQGGQQNEKLAIRAPIAGVVAERNANPGLEVRPDAVSPLFVITDLNRLSLVVDLAEKYLADVTVGDDVQIEVPAYPGKLFSGRVERIAPVVDPATRRVQVRASVDNAAGLLKPEMYARVSLLKKHAVHLPSIPTGALLVEGIQNFVFVEKSPGTYVKTQVTLAEQTRDRAYVASGLQVGERVVSVGALLLDAELAGNTSQGH